MAPATPRSTASSVWSHRNTTPGNVCSTSTVAPGVTPSASRRSPLPPACAPTSTTIAHVPSASADNGTGREPGRVTCEVLELNAERTKDIIQTRSGEDGHRRHDAQNGKARLQTALADHHQKVGHAGNEQGHHGQRDNCLQSGQLTGVREPEQSCRAVVASQEPMTKTWAVD